MQLHGLHVLCSKCACGPSPFQLRLLAQPLLACNAADSEQCFSQPKEGYQCQTVPPVNGGKKFALVLGIFVVAGTMIWVNGL
jgi:hypothetical protein